MTYLSKLFHKNWYPWLIAFYPVVYLYSKNLGMVDIRVVGAVLLVVLLGVGIIFNLLRLITKHASVSAAITTLLVLCYSNYYGAIYRQLANLPGVLRYSRFFLGIVMLGLVIGLGWVLYRKANTLKELIPYFNSAALVLLLFPLYSIVSYQSMRLSNTEMGTAPSPCETLPSPADPALAPDIYYIITDAYPRADVLLERNDFDNSAFIEALESRGFYVASKSVANFPHTRLSIPSSLNMSYFEELTGIQEGLIGYRHTRNLVGDSLVAKELLCHGYTYLYLDSGFFPNSHLVNADELQAVNLLVFDQAGMESGRFLDTLFNSTVLYHQNIGVVASFRSMILNHPALADILGDWENPEIFFTQIDDLNQIASMPEATFSFAHLLKPHFPFIFDKNGNIVLDYRSELAINPPPEEAYRVTDQIEYLNTVLLETVDHILATSPIPPIIIIQGDHGMAFGGYTNPYSQYPFEILNAYYLPDGADAQLYAEISPVNTFRLILDYYFGTNYELLPDRHFDIPNGYNPFQFEEVTDDFH